METNFWNGFFASLECEIKKVKEIQGASGIRHKILSLGVDEKQKRIIIVQDEQDARILSMVQADVQAKIKDYNILMVRPVSINLSNAFNSAALLLGTYKLTQGDLENFSKKGEPVVIVEENKKKIESVINLISPQIEIIQKTKPNLVSVFKEIVQQLSHLKFLGSIERNESYSIDFEELLNFNPVVYDTNLGICPIPFYNFSVEEAESFLKPQNVFENQLILKKHAIHQFFNPPPDSLALGLIETENYTSRELIKQVSKVPELGHPFGQNELTDIKNLNHMVEALKEKGLVVEGEFSMGITEEGKEKRMLVKLEIKGKINYFIVKY